METIISVAAIWREDPPVIISAPPPWRHDDLRMAFCEVKTNLRMGFLTSTGRFVNRREAAHLAYQAGQIKYETTDLISQDLW